MSLKNRIVIVNISIVAGLLFEYFRGAPMLAVWTSGIFLLLLVNAIFGIRWRRMHRQKKSVQTDGNCT